MVKIHTASALIAIAALAAPLSATVGAAQASPAASPSASQAVSGVNVTWRLTHRRANAGDIDKVVYRITGAKRASAHLQRQFGSAHVWKDVKRLDTGSGEHKTKFAVPALGKYRYRVRVAQGANGMATRPKSLWSYGSVTLADLRSNPTSKTVEVNGQLFRWNYQHDFSSYGNTQAFTVLKRDTTSCRRIDAQMALVSPDSEAVDPWPMRVTQEDADVQEFTLARDVVSSWTIKLTGRAFKWSGKAPVYEHSSTGAAYINATASCFTRNGIR